MSELREDLLNIDIDSIVDSGNKKGQKKTKKIVVITIAAMVLLLGGFFALRPILYHNACVLAGEGDFSAAAAKLKFVGNYKGSKKCRKDLEFLTENGSMFIELLDSSFSGEDKFGYSIEEGAFSIKQRYPHTAEELFSNPSPEVYCSWLSAMESIDNATQTYADIFHEAGFGGQVQIVVVDSNEEPFYISKNGEEAFIYTNQEELAEKVFSAIYSKIVQLAKEESFAEAASEWEQFCSGKTFEVEYKDLAKYVSYVTALKDCNGDTWTVSTEGIAALKDLPDSFEKRSEYYNKINEAIKTIKSSILYQEKNGNTYCINAEAQNGYPILYKMYEYSNIREYESTWHHGDVDYYRDNEEGTTYEIVDGQVTAISVGCGPTGYDFGFAVRIDFNEQGAIVSSAQKFSRSTAYFAEDYAEEFSGTYYWSDILGNNAHSGENTKPADTSNKSDSTSNKPVDMSNIKLGVTESGNNVHVTVKKETDAGTVTCVMTFWYEGGKLTKETADYYVPNAETAGVLADELKQDATIVASSVSINSNCVSCTMKDSELAELKGLTRDELIIAMKQAIGSM